MFIPIFTKSEIRIKKNEIIANNFENKYGMFMNNKRIAFGFTLLSSILSVSLLESAAYQSPKEPIDITF